MKNLILLSISLLLSTTFLFAQEDSKLKNEKKETIIKTTTIKGADEKTTITKTVKEENQLIKIKDTGKENQNEEYDSKKNTYTTETKTVKINTENEVAKKELKEKQDNDQQKEIDAYKKAQMEKYEKMKKEAEEKKKKNNKDN